jgi:hypothetical protein
LFPLVKTFFKNTKFLQESCLIFINKLYDIRHRIK